jgi:hypothetical protein
MSPPQATLGKTINSLAGNRDILPLVGRAVNKEGGTLQWIRLLSSTIAWSLLELPLKGGGSTGFPGSYSTN